jgi:predicted RNase H-like nuclease (RuvC/YqgF family)
MPDHSNDGLYAAVDEVRRKTEFLHTRVEEVKEQVSSLEGRIERLEEQMKASNRHLTTLVTEAKTTNAILREDLDHRKTLDQHRMVMEREEKEWRRKVEERSLETQAQAVQFKRTLAHEAWEMFKQPLGMLITAAVAWAAWHYFTVPSSQVLNAAPSSPAPSSQEPQEDKQNP